MEEAGELGELAGKKAGRLVRTVEVGLAVTLALVELGDEPVKAGEGDGFVDLCFGEHDGV